MDGLVKSVLLQAVVYGFFWLAWRFRMGDASTPWPAAQKAVALIRKRALVEVSGVITQQTVADMAQTGVDFISVAP